MQQVGQWLAVVHVGRCYAGAMNQAAGAVHANVRFHAKVPLLAYPVWCISGSRVLSLFLVELGAAMMVASTMVPPHSFKPLDNSSSPTLAKMASPSLWVSSRRRGLGVLPKFSTVVASGTPSRPRSTPQNSRKASMSYSASSQASSARLNQLAMQYMRSIKDIERGGLPFPALG